MPFISFSYCNLQKNMDYEWWKRTSLLAFLEGNLQSLTTKYTDRSRLFWCCCSVAQSCPMNSLRPHELQHTSPLCPSPGDFVDGLYLVKEIPCYHESFYNEWILNFIKCFFWIYWDDHVTFVFWWCVVSHSLICVPSL